MLNYSRVKCLINALPYQLVKRVTEKYNIDVLKYNTIKDFDRILRVTKKYIDGETNVLLILNKDKLTSSNVKKLTKNVRKYRLTFNFSKLALEPKEITVPTAEYRIDQRISKIIDDFSKIALQFRR